MNRLYAYIVRWDDGFAPNPFQGVCTLACCKYVTRRVAQVGDYIVGLGSKNRGNRLVYAMQISETMTFDEYWRDPRFRAKRPDVDAGGEKALGDNIYHWDGQEYRQEPSRHSNKDGTEDLKNKRHDTKCNDYWVLISDDFTYWGGESPLIDDNLQFLPKALEHAPRGHKVGPPGPGRRNCSFTQEQVDAFIEWFKRQERGRLGMPTNGCPNRSGRASASARPARRAATRNAETGAAPSPVIPRGPVIPAKRSGRAWARGERRGYLKSRAARP